MRTQPCSYPQAVVNFPHMGSELWSMPDFVTAALRRVDAHREFQEAGPTPTTQAGLRWREVCCTLSTNIAALCRDLPA